MGNAAYRYSESGLGQVTLVGGVTHHDTPYGKGQSITAVGRLHAAIRAAVLERPGMFDGRVLKFLRGELEVDIAGLAAMLGVAVDALRGFEADERGMLPAELVEKLSSVASDRLGTPISSARKSYIKHTDLLFNYNGDWNLM